MIGLSGVTNGGKSTLSSRLKLHFDPGVVEICALDDHFIKDTSQLAYVESLQMHNWDRMSSLDWEKYYAEATTLIDRWAGLKCH